MKKIAILYLMVSLCACHNSTTKDAAKSYQQTKDELKQQETKDPKGFISINGHSRKNLIGQLVVTGTVTNNATVAAFKDVDVQFMFYSKTGTLIEKDRETIYEDLAPGGFKHFKSKYFAPKGTDSVAFEIMGAKVSP